MKNEIRKMKHGLAATSAISHISYSILHISPKATKGAL